MKKLRLKQSNNDPCIYILETRDAFLVVGVFVDDLVITGSSMENIKDFIEKLSQKFKVKDMGKLHYFLRVKVNQKPDKIWIGQPTYTKEILEKFDMENSKSVATPVKRMPIYERLPYALNMNKDQKDQQVKDTLHQLTRNITVGKIATVVPRRVFENTSFIINTEYLKTVNDILANESGVWLNNGLRASQCKKFNVW